jgi:uncharacterized protein (TIGR01244 family)
MIFMGEKRAMKRINTSVSFIIVLSVVIAGVGRNTASTEKRHQDQPSGGKVYRCIPCGCGRDQEVFDKPGPCPACTMALVDDEVTSITRFLRVNDQYCTGGQPTMEQLAKLKAEGTKVIINLRHTDEPGVVQEIARAKELGFRYFHIPVVYRDPKDEQVDEFLRVMDDPENRPAFVHCTAAIRVGAFWMIRRVLRDGWTIEKAEEEARKIGLTDRATHLLEFARAYIERRRKK